MQQWIANPAVLVRWLAAIALALFAGIALAQRNLAVAPATANEQRVALVIGNSSYKDAPLRNPVNDATDVAAALKGLGFNVILRTNANRRQMVEGVREFGNQIKRGGVGFFYYAGHGVQSGGKNFLVPVSAQLEGEADLEFETMDAGMVLAQMDLAGNRVNIVVLDACRDNPFARSFRSASRGLAQMDSAKGSFLAYATSPGSVAADGTGRNGIYTKHLLESLKAPDTRLEEVFRRTRQGVAKETGNKQIPWDSSSVLGHFYFRPPSGGAQLASLATQPPVVVAPVDPSANDRVLWEAVKDSKSPGDYEAYLEQFPQGLFSTLARSRLKSLQGTQVAVVAPSPPVAPLPILAPPNTIALMRPGEVFRDCADCPEMVVIPAGSFLMGSPASEQARLDSEGPQHQVTLARPFAGGKFEVTFDDWNACVREGGCSHRPGDEGWGQGRRPVINVSWQDAKTYTDWLSRKTGKRYRLLTEAEWEYVARAGTSTAFSTGANINPTQANYYAWQSFAGSVTGLAQNRTVEVGRFQPNAFGLHDVHGNVWEWTEDCWNPNHYEAPPDGSASTSGGCGQRVLRGGSWSSIPQILRSAVRGGSGSGSRSYVIGFRLARSD